MNKDTWAKAKKLVNERDRGLCQKCLGEATAVHHRMPKGMGGTADPDRNYGLANLVSLCDACHRHVHANPDESYANGFLVHSWDDPITCPVLLADDTVVIYLKADGNVEKYLQQPLF